MGGSAGLSAHLPNPATSPYDRRCGDEGFGLDLAPGTRWDEQLVKYTHASGGTTSREVLGPEGDFAPTP